MKKKKIVNQFFNFLFYTGFFFPREKFFYKFLNVKNETYIDAVYQAKRFFEKVNLQNERGPG
jgi:hypothetical protein